ncbi:MAG: hypothetical protein Aurels2KO_19680 [Aureliella sp.]
MDTHSVDHDTEIDQLQWGTFGDWIQLVRLPTSFTLLSNCLAAGIVAGHLWWPMTAFIPTLLASLFAYWAGMIHNDVVDQEEDRRSRPNRPLVSGRISPVIAGHIANGMLLLGPLIILAVTFLHTSDQLWLLAAFMSSGILSCCVRFYNSPIKHTILGPVVMGACRAMNIIMVGATMLAVNTLPPIVDENAPVPSTVQFPAGLVGLAIGIGIYIVGVTFYARKEEGDSSPATLSFGVLLQVVGLVVIGGLGVWTQDQYDFKTLNPVRGYPLLIGLIGLTIVNRAMAGVRHPVSRKVQLAVKHSILSLILIDAAVVLMWAGPWHAAVLIALLVPALASSLRVRST